MKNAKIQKFKCDILSNFQPMCKMRLFQFFQHYAQKWMIAIYYYADEDWEKTAKEASPFFILQFLSFLVQCGSVFWQIGLPSFILIKIKKNAVQISEKLKTQNVS